MRKLFPYIALVGAAVGITWLLKKAQGYGSIVPDLVGVEFKFNNLVPTILLKFRIRNTAELPVILNRISGHLYLNGGLVGAATTSGTINIPAAQEQIVLVNFIPSGSGIIQQLAEIYQMVEGSRYVAATFLFDGQLNIGGVDFPVKLSYKLI